MGGGGHDWVGNSASATHVILTDVQQPFGRWDAITPTRTISDLVWKLVLGKIPIPPAVLVFRGVLCRMLRSHVVILERGQRALRSRSERA